jgi:uncharacterized protein (TIGR00297 family)
MMERALIGAIVAALITALARRLEMLDESGQWAAFACGIAAAAAGWPWAAVLVIYFSTASAVTRMGAATKAERTQRAVPQVNIRNWLQVLANGGLFALFALRAADAPESRDGLAAAGALAAASADTWATELGTLWGGRPRSILHWRHTAPGMSGGVTPVGTLGGLAGAILVAVVAAALFRLPLAGTFAGAVVIGGMTGCIADSVIGATFQARRWCDHCKEWTERRVHPCSYRTVHAAGVRWVSNDVVNTAATLVGAVATVLAARALR